MTQSFKDLNFGAHDTLEGLLDDLNNTIGKKANQEEVGDLTTLQTNDKSSLVNAVNEHTTQLAQSVTKLKNRWISIIDSPYNAKADWNGTSGTDNTTAIQNAINDAIEGTTIIIPYMANSFLVNGTITPKSNIEILCFGTLFVPSSATYHVVFNGSIGITNFKASGIRCLSTNDKTRAVGRSGLGSNVFLFQFSNSSKITLEYLYGENLEYLIKVDGSSSDFTFNAIETKGTFQPMYITDIQKVRGKKWMFDCPNTGSTLDHHLYWNAGIIDAVVDDIICKNGTGQAIQIANTNNVALVTRDIYLTNVKFYNVYEAVVITSGDIINVNIDKIYGSGCATGRYWLEIGFGMSGKVIENITFSNFFFENHGSSLIASNVQNGVNPKNVILKKGICKGRFAANILLPDGLKNIILDDVLFTDASPVDGTSHILYSATTANEFWAVLNNCTFIFETALPGNVPVSVRNTGYYEVTVKNSRFLNLQGSDYVGIINNSGGGKSSFVNNEYKGFTNVLYSDTITQAHNNFNIKTNTFTA